MKKLEQVYFIQAHQTGLIKIGYTKSIISRFKSLQNQTSDFLILLIHMSGTRKLERDLHEMFAEYRLQGEWFAPGERLLGLIDELRQNCDPERLALSENFKAWTLLMWQSKKGMNIPPGVYYGATVEAAPSPEPTP